MRYLARPQAATQAADDPAEAMRVALGVGLTEVKHPGHPYYVMAPGGQVFTIVPMH